MHRNPTTESFRVAFGLCLFLCVPCLHAQETSDLKQILQRLDRLENENRALAEEIRALRKQLSAPSAAPAALEERADVQEQRIGELAQTKVEASQKNPLQISGMALFNAFVNGKQNGGSENPTVASIARGQATDGGTLRQSTLGLNYHGSQTSWGGTVNGSLLMDFFGGTTNALNHLLRIRVATISLDWKNTSFMVGQDKPIVSPREPNSLAQIGVSPLTGAGNLWLWEPQARVEQRFRFGPASEVRAQFGLFQTSEASAAVPAEYAATLSRGRPGVEGRFEFAHKFGESSRVEIAPAFHYSRTHVVGFSVPSSLVSVDWLVRPTQRIEFTGMFYSGQNIANLGTIRQGFTILEGRLGDHYVIPVHSKGGWAQLRIMPAERLSFNIYGGQHDDRNADLQFGSIAKNQGYAANIMYRLAPNVILSFEGAQVRTTYLNIGNRLNNHYDLAVAYLF